MRKIKTSLSLDGDRLRRLKRLAGQERRSVSQLMDMALDQILPVLADEQLTLEEIIAPAASTPKISRQEATV